MYDSNILRDQYAQSYLMSNSQVQHEEYSSLKPISTSSRWCTSDAAYRNILDRTLFGQQLNSQQLQSSSSSSVSLVHSSNSQNQDFKLQPAKPTLSIPAYESFYGARQQHIQQLHNQSMVSSSSQSPCGMTTRTGLEDSLLNMTNETTFSSLLNQTANSNRNIIEGISEPAVLATAQQPSLLMHDLREFNSHSISYANSPFQMNGGLDSSSLYSNESNTTSKYYSTRRLSDHRRMNSEGGFLAQNGISSNPYAQQQYQSESYRQNEGVGLTFAELKAKQTHYEEFSGQPKWVEEKVKGVAKTKMVRDKIASVACETTESRIQNVAVKGCPQLLQVIDQLRANILNDFENLTQRIVGQRGSVGQSRGGIQLGEYPIGEDTKVRFSFACDQVIAEVCRNRESRTLGDESEDDGVVVLGTYSAPFDSMTFQQQNSQSIRDHNVSSMLASPEQNIKRKCVGMLPYQQSNRVVMQISQELSEIDDSADKRKGEMILEQLISDKTKQTNKFNEQFNYQPLSNSVTDKQYTTTFPSPSNSTSVILSQETIEKATPCFEVSSEKQLAYSSLPAVPSSSTSTTPFCLPTDVYSTEFGNTIYPETILIISQSPHQPSQISDNNDDDVVIKTDHTDGLSDSPQPLTQTLIPKDEDDEYNASSYLTNPYKVETIEQEKQHHHHDDSPVLQGSPEMESIYVNTAISYVSTFEAPPMAMILPALTNLPIVSLDLPSTASPPVQQQLIEPSNQSLKSIPEKPVLTSTITVVEKKPENVRFSTYLQQHKDSDPSLLSSPFQYFTPGESKYPTSSIQRKQSSSIGIPSQFASPGDPKHRRNRPSQYNQPNFRDYMSDIRSRTPPPSQQLKQQQHHQQKQQFSQQQQPSCYSPLQIAPLKLDSSDNSTLSQFSRSRAFPEATFTRLLFDDDTDVQTPVTFVAKSSPRTANFATVDPVNSTQKSPTQEANKTRSVSCSISSVLKIAETPEKKKVDVIIIEQEPLVSDVKSEKDNSFILTPHNRHTSTHNSSNLSKTILKKSLIGSPLMTAEAAGAQPQLSQFVKKSNKSISFKPNIEEVYNFESDSDQKYQTSIARSKSPLLRAEHKQPFFNPIKKFPGIQNNMSLASQYHSNSPQLIPFQSTHSKGMSAHAIRRPSHHQQQQTSEGGKQSSMSYSSSSNVLNKPSKQSSLSFLEYSKMAKQQSNS